MVMLSNLQFKGISFEIIEEEIKEVCCEEKLFLIMRVTNNTDKKKKLAHSLNYISVSQGLKRGSVLTLNFGVYGTFLQANAFVDLEIQFDGITRVVDETSFKLFCEVLALNGEVVNQSFGVEVAVYDSDDNIVYHTSLHSSDFKGFEVYNFGTINLDIPVDEVSKIRIYPV